MPHLPLPKPVGSALDLIGHTPMLELHGFDTGPCTLFLKLENTNPGGSIKDRIALTMIEAAEQDGRLKPGGTIIEATAGNTGLGLAQVGILKGYRLILVVPDKMSREKIQHLRGLGVDVRLTRSDVGKGHPEYYQDIAERIAADTDNAVFINQFANPANPLAHETTTGPEILEQMDGDVDAVVCGVGSGGTLTGLGRFFAKRLAQDADDRRRSRRLHPRPADQRRRARGARLLGGGGDRGGLHPAQLRPLSFTHKAYAVSDSDSMAAARELLRVAGVLGGSSSGTLLAAALRYCRDQSEPQRVVTFVCDTGSKYLSKMFNDYWLADQGLAQRPMHDNLADLISRRATEGGVVTVAPEDTLLTAYNRMRAADVSQLPVLKDGRLVGLLDESDILFAAEREHERKERFARPVYTAMATRLNTIQVREPLESLLPVFERDEVALVMEGREFLGVITRIDLINHLRRA